MFEQLEERVVCGRLASLEAAYADYLVGNVNLLRAQVGLPPLTVNPVLAADARAEANYQARHGYRGDDGFPDDVPVYRGWLAQNAAENDGFSRGFGNAARFMAIQWLQSPEHYANIVNAHWTEIGVGVAAGKAWMHRRVWYGIEIFGVPDGP
jgi:uncharacterized protein YkwD